MKVVNPYPTTLPCSRQSLIHSYTYQNSWSARFWAFSCLHSPSHYRNCGNIDACYHVCLYMGSGIYTPCLSWHGLWDLHSMSVLTWTLRSTVLGSILRFTCLHSKHHTVSLIHSYFLNFSFYISFPGYSFISFISYSSFQIYLKIQWITSAIFSVSIFLLDSCLWIWQTPNSVWLIS